MDNLKTGTRVIFRPLVVMVDRAGLQLEGQRGTVVEHTPGLSLKVRLTDYGPELDEWGSCVEWLVGEQGEHAGLLAEAEAALAVTAVPSDAASRAIVEGWCFGCESRSDAAVEHNDMGCACGRWGKA